MTKSSRSISARLKNFTARGLCLAFTLMLPLTGCASLGHMTSGPVTRQQGLSEILPEFHRAVYWGKFNEAAVFVQPEKRITFVNGHVAKRRKENLVELEVGNIDFNAESDSAKVEVVVKFFKNTNYTVASRKEEETWKFSGTEGWQFQSAEDLGLVDESDRGPTLQRGQS